MLPDEYPELPTVTGEDVIRVDLDPAIIAQGLRHTLFAASADETKQILTGVHLQLEQQLIRFISTDGHRCAVYEHQKQEVEQVDSTGPHEDCQITIKNTGCSEMLKVLAKTKEPVNLAFNHAYLRLTAGSSSIICRRLEGQYPNALTLFPQFFATTIEIDRKQFTSALQRINVVADQKNYIVKCQIDRQQSEILLKADTEGSVGLETIAAEVSDLLPESSEENTPSQELVSLFAINSKYLLAGLSVIESEKVQLKINTALKPITLQDDGTMKYLIMPVQMRS
jgi:DNA polymerase-3 subunit beta